MHSTVAFGARARASGPHLTRPIPPVPVNRPLVDVDAVDGDVTGVLHHERVGDLVTRPRDERRVDGLVQVQLPVADNVDGRDRIARHDHGVTRRQAPRVYPVDNAAVVDVALGHLVGGGAGHALPRRQARRRGRAVMVNGSPCPEK